MNEIIKGSNTLLPNGYAKWRKDIEHLIDTAKYRAALNVNVGTLTLYIPIFQFCKRHLQN